MKEKRNDIWLYAAVRHQLGAINAAAYNCSRYRFSTHRTLTHSLCAPCAHFTSSSQAWHRRASCVEGYLSKTSLCGSTQHIAAACVTRRPLASRTSRSQISAKRRCSLFLCRWASALFNDGEHIEHQNSESKHHGAASKNISRHCSERRAYQRISTHVAKHKNQRGREHGGKKNSWRAAAEKRRAA